VAHFPVAGKSNKMAIFTMISTEAEAQLADDHVKSIAINWNQLLDIKSAYFID
jgi:hypothetical protein